MTRVVSRSSHISVLGMKAAALIAVAVAGSGCADSIGDIDRTQPGLIAKKNFEGQWFLRETVVDVPETSPASFVGVSGDMEMLAWEIQEDHLVGFRAYEQIPGLDNEAASALAKPSSQPVAPGLGDGRDTKLYKGAPVVAYKIQEHVDVQRGYNARTGEQNNIIQENTNDRPWYEREFIRVDWSQNDVLNLMQMSPTFSAFATMSSYVPQNEGGPDAFKMEIDKATGTANYMDFTTRYIAEPSVMACIAMLNSRLGDCTGDEIKLRTSLVKVDPQAEQEYVPLVYDDRREGEFGFFRVERPTYDRRLGNTFTGMIQVAGRHDIWQQSRDASGVPLAFAARTLKPLTYTLSENFPDSLRKVADEIAVDYDSAFKKVIAAARNNQSVADLERDLKNDTGDTCLFCLDQNQNNEARNGDLRRNFVYWVDEQQAAGPLGFGPSSLNPETGRNVSANAYVYGAGVDRYAEQAKEIVELMIPEAEGGLSPDDLTSGDYFRQAIRGNLPPIDPRKLDRLAGLSGDALAQTMLGKEGFERLAAIGKEGKDGIPTAVPGLDQARLARLVGTDVEAKMLPSEWARDQAAGKPSYLKARADLLKKRAELYGEPEPKEGPLGYLSLTNWFGPDAMKDVKELEDVTSRNNIWMANFDDPAIAGLAKEFAGSRLAGDDLFNALRERIFRAVMLHELGHTMGLRHNFAGSADALNFQDDYWPQRVKTIDPLTQYTQTSAPASTAFLRSNCSVQEPLQRASDLSAIAGTDTSAACAAQLDGKMAEMQYSSIMDYGSRFNSDIHGLGHYDIAALAAGYGDLVEVFDEDAMKGIAAGSSKMGVDVRQAMVFANTVRNPILFQGLDNAMAQIDRNRGVTLSHYTNYPALLGGYQNIAKRRFMPRTEYLTQLNASQNQSVAQRASVPVKVPYMACYDEYVDSVDTCHRYDAGADNDEIVNSLVTGYQQYYVFNNFQRDRVGFDPFQVALRTAQRYFLPLTNMYQHWLWGRFITGITPAGSPRGDLGLLATGAGLDLLRGVMATPEYGAHIYSATTGEYVPVDGQCPETGEVYVPASTDGVVGAGSTPPLQGPLVSMPMCVDVPRGVGRSFFSQYDSSGYDVFRRILESGHYYDQLAAMAALQASNASVVGIGSDVNADARTFRIPYNLAFKQPLEDLFSSIYEEKDSAYAPHMEMGTAGAQVVQRSIFDDPALPNNAPVIAPGRSYTTRVQSLVAGMNLLDGTLNPSFARQGQISLLGSGEQRTPPAGFDAVQVSDPASGRMFVAYRKTGNVDGPWYGADMLDQAQKIKDDPSLTDQDRDSALSQIFGDIEFVRFAFNILGE